MLRTRKSTTNTIIMTDRYESRDSTSTSSSYDRQLTFTFTQYTDFEADIESAFGTSSDFGQSLGVAFENVEVIDGGLYLADNGKMKLFSLSKSGAIDPEKALERDMDVDVDDVDEFMHKDYNVAEVDYDLVAARVPEITDGDGNVLIEASSKKRELEVDKDGNRTFGDWEDFNGDTVSVEDNLVSYFGASEENGASTESQRMAEVLTQFGSNATEDTDDAYNWLADTSGQNILRSDLKDRRVEIIKVVREGEDSGYDYHFPIVLDVKTGTEIAPMNRDDEPDTTEAKTEKGTTDSPQEAYPGPIADFISSGVALDLSKDRAETLLDDMITDGENPLDQTTVDEVGREEIINEVT